MHQIQNLMFMKFSTFKYCSIVCRGNLVSHSQRCATFEPSRNIRAAANTQICDEIRGLMPATTINNVFERIDVSPSIAALLCNSGTACLRSRDKTKYIQSHLYSPLIPRELLKTSSVQHTPARYPQYTSDRTIGKWEWFCGPVDDRLFSADAVRDQCTATALSWIWCGRRRCGLARTRAKLAYSRDTAGSEEPCRTRRGISDPPIRAWAPIVRAFHK